MARGRLIYPFLARVGCLNTAATEAANGGAGYDLDFHEPVRVDDGTVTGSSTRAETIYEVQVQVEPVSWDRMHMVVAGDARDQSVYLIAHFRELERNGWVLEDGTTVFKPNARLISIHSLEPGNPLMLAIPASPGLYLREALPLGFGFGRRRNLLQLDFRARVAARG